MGGVLGRKGEDEGPGSGEEEKGGGEGKTRRGGAGLCGAGAEGPAVGEDGLRCGERVKSSRRESWTFVFSPESEYSGENCCVYGVRETVQYGETKKG